MIRKRSELVAALRLRGMAEVLDREIEVAEKGGLSHQELLDENQR